MNHEAMMAHTAAIVIAAIHAGLVAHDEIADKIKEVYTALLNAATPSADDQNIQDPVAKALKETRGSLADVDFMDDER